MKKTLPFLALILLCSNSLSAQSFVSTNNQWNVHAGGMGGATTEFYKIAGDSIFNGKTYSQIWVSVDSMANWQNSGILREDSNIVYYVNEDSIEGILYNFNLEIGDTASIKNRFSYNSTIHIEIMDIDTVVYYGVARKRWLLENTGGMGQEIWIEGIGSLSGPLHTKYWDVIVCPFWELLCFHENDDLRYMLAGANSCYIHSIGINENTKISPIRVSPNPIKHGEQLKINYEFLGGYRIEIHNSAGALIESFPWTREQRTNLETHQLSPGLYIIQIHNKGGQFFSKKVIVE